MFYFYILTLNIFNYPYTLFIGIGKESDIFRGANYPGQYVFREQKMHYKNVCVVLSESE